LISQNISSYQTSSNKADDVFLLINDVTLKYFNITHQHLVINFISTILKQVIYK